MEWVEFRQLAHGKWEMTAPGKIRYSSRGVEIQTDDQPLIDHFSGLLEEGAVVSNLVAINHTNHLIGGKYRVDSADAVQINLKAAGIQRW